MPVYPIVFSIPKEKIVCSIPIKTKILSSLVPGDINTYIYQNEKDYYKEYQTSYFAITKKKAGWDCMRHYEILANGCIPYFIDIENCPKNTLSLLPKELLIEASKLYKNFSLENIEIYNNLLLKLLEYTKNYLTTKQIAKYILEKTNFENVSKILYLSGNTDPDYLRCLTLHGFKELFGSNCHDYPKVPHLYKSDSINYYQLYGKGITYTNLLNENLHNNDLDSTIEKDIENKYYNIIIYGSFHRGIPFYNLVSKVYQSNEIILLCGEDSHNCNYNLNLNHHLFIRELE